MDANKNSIQVLMMGARRAGKTSTLSGLYSIVNSEALKAYLTVKDVTPDKTALTTLSEMQNFIEETLKLRNGKEVLMGSKRTNTFLDYTFEISVPESKGTLKLTFTDVNGEFYANGNIHRDEMQERIAQYDIIVVAIDTPYLMEMYNRENTLCTFAVGEAYNQVDTVHTLLSDMDDNEGKNAKLVFFVPIKCEYWACHGRINEVTEKVEEVYKTPIKALCSYKNIEVVILPVQTIGSVEFSAHREAKVLSNAKLKEGLRCSPWNDLDLILEDGSIYSPKNDDLVQDDPDSKIEGFSLIRPNCWFKVISDHYAPHNCDQLAYYILQFALTKSLELKRQVHGKEKRKHWWRIPLAIALVATGMGWLGAGVLVYHYISKRLGNIDIEKLQETITAIKDEGIWKTSEDGIKILNKGLLP